MAHSEQTPETTPPRRQARRVFGEADKLQGVAYDIRGEVTAEAERMELDGHTILKLNTGNPR